MSNEVQTYVEQSVIFDDSKMAALVKFSELMAQATVTVPKHLHGKPGDCLAIAMQATQWGMNPFAVAQKTHLVNGTLGYESQLVNAVVCSSGAISGSFEYEYSGDGENVSCRVGAVLRGQSEIKWGPWLSARSVTTKNSPVWKTNPAQQLSYLQVKNWARLYCPAAILGVYSVDELEYSPPMIRDMGQAQVVPPEIDFDVIEAEIGDIDNIMTLGKYCAGWKAKIGECDALNTIRALYSERKKQIEAAASPTPPADQYASEGGDYVA